MAKNATSKFANVIFKVLVHSGCPTVYQLTPRKEHIGRVTRLTLGEKDAARPNKTILLIGETGTGKSTLINTLVNYTMGVTWEDDVWFQIVEDEKRGETDSQKSEVIVYQIFGFEGRTLPYSLTIIDTPGYGDTAGIERDVVIRDRLFDFFQSVDGIHEVDTVGLVLKASVNRLNDRLRYVFDSAQSLFGKDVEKNIVVLFTFSDGRTPRNALKALEASKVKCARNEKNQPVHFLFDNCQHQDRTEYREDLQYANEVSLKGIKQFSHFLEKTTPQSLETTVAVLNARIQLIGCVQSLQERVEIIEFQQREIHLVQESLKKYKEKMIKKQNYFDEVDEVYKEREAVRGRATCCTICEENCHYPGCTIALHPECCEVMRLSRCTVCKGKCHVQFHVKENWIFVDKIRKVQKINTNRKWKYETYKAECDSKIGRLEKLQKKLEEPRKERDRWLEKFFQHFVTLEQISLRADSLSTIIHLDFVIDQMMEKGDTEKVQKMEEMRHRVIKYMGTGGLQYISPV
ncbi:uncharacterized protein [Antennarius striatus]|uniref:uncharacterized protein n=1 Tax=Antennarius striatus TaxID=241820 RepID=UPI0035B374C7